MMLACILEKWPINFCVLFRNIWADRKVLVKHVQHCHLVEYHQQLLSMVLSHCHYSLKHGEQQELTYEFAALEKSFIDRFVHGKPMITLQIPEVRYLEDSYSIANVKRVMPSKVSCIIVPRVNNSTVTIINS